MIEWPEGAVAMRLYDSGGEGSPKEIRDISREEYERMSANKEPEIPKVDKYGKISIELTGNPSRDKIEIDGKKLPVQQVWISSDVSETTVEITALKLPSGDPYIIEGYLISEEDHERLRTNKPMR